MRWSADPPLASEDAESDRLGQRRVTGTVIRFMCDYGVEMPLWDEDGPLPSDYTWLSDELGLSRELVTDLAAWASDWDSPGTTDPGRLQEWIQQRPEHGAQGRRLFERLRSEVADHFEVVNQERATH